MDDIFETAHLLERLDKLAGKNGKAAGMLPDGTVWVVESKFIPRDPQPDIDDLYRVEWDEDGIIDPQL